MSPDELKKVIAEAIVEAEQIKRDKLIAEQKIQDELDLKEWQAALGFKESTKKSAIRKEVEEFFSSIKMIFKLPFVKESAIKGDYSIYTLFSLALSILFFSAQILIPVLSFVLWYAFVTTCNFSLLSSAIYFILFLLYTFLFIGLFRMAKIEMKHIKDMSLLLTLFTSITSIISIVIAILTLWKE